MSRLKRKNRKKILIQNDEVIATIVNRELNEIRAEHLEKGDLNMVVSRLVKKVRETSADSNSDENKIVTKAKKGPSLSEIN
jgi:predicted transcriptional regulator